MGKKTKQTGDSKKFSILKRGIGIESEKYANELKIKKYGNKLEIKKVWKQVKDGSEGL